MNAEDRRRKRSADPLIALHYQLSQSRKDAELDTLVLADVTGVMVAGAGSWAACEELAAYAPLFAEQDLGGAIASRIASLQGEVVVRELAVAGQDVLLCARGAASEGRSAALQRAAEGITRILRAA